MSESVIFRAGIADFDQSSGLCTPQPLQGEIKIRPNAEEPELGFWDFEWHSVESGSNKHPEPVSLILIPGETKLVQLQSCHTGRMFALVFSSNEKYFFWLQERNSGTNKLSDLSDRDQELFSRIKSILNQE